MSDFIKFLSGGGWQAVVAMVLIVLVVAAIVLVLIMAFSQGREVSLWPPKVGPRLSGSESQAKAVSAKVRSPRSGASVDRGFRVEGTFEKLPDGYELWVATTDGARYWPQTRATAHDDGSWMGKVHYIGGPSGGVGTFAVFAVGPDGQTLLSQYKEITEYWKKQAAAGTRSAPLTRVTRDMRKCHEIDVLVKPG